MFTKQGRSRAPQTKAPPQTSRAESAVRIARYRRPSCRSRDGGIRLARVAEVAGRGMLVPQARSFVVTLSCARVRVVGYRLSAALATRECVPAAWRTL